MLVVFLGPPGAGKGTQAARLSTKYGLPKVSTGDMLREAVAAGNELGERVGAIMEAGELVPDDTMAAVVEQRLARPDCEGGAILDGYPRTVRQAELLEGIATRTSLGGVDLVLLLSVPEQELVRRLSGRRVCAECGANYHVEFNPPAREGVCDRCGGELRQRGDDTEDAIRERLRVYREQTGALAGHYRAGDTLHEVDGRGDIDDVFRRVDAVVSGAVRA